MEGGDIPESLVLEGAYTSPKIRRLAVVLGVPWPHAIGLAGLLWRFAAKHAPTGEIGRHDNEEVAAFLEWPGPSDDLIDALIRCRLLDEADPPIRFIVHDWPDHAPRYVRATLHRRGQDFSALYPNKSAVGHSVPTADQTTDQSAVRTTYTSTSTSTSSSNRSASSPVSSQNAKKENCDEETARAVPLLEGVVHHPRPANVSQVNARTANMVPEVILEAIWNMWVPGRKKGKKVGKAKIARSILRLSKSGAVSMEQAARQIAEQTQRDAEKYKRQVESGRLELKYVPTAGTYFSQERWDDNDNEPDIKSIRKESFKDELDRARKNMG
jgi:hypothetical protein